jgi:hypothetical protein
MRQMQSASVMDYSAKFNDRFDGVGYYDRAAVKFGYGGLVEVYNQTPNSAKFDKYLENPEASDPNNVATLPDPSSKLEKMFKRVHYTKIPELFDNVDAIYDRSDVPHTAIPEGSVEVPYRFCSDELAGELPLCERWDSGVDNFEMVRNALSDYENYWVIWGQWHDSVLFNPNIYYSRIMRVFGAVKHQMQWWATNYHRFNKNDWWKERFGVNWHEDAVGGLAGAVAVADGVNTMVSAFGRPQPGYHGYRSVDNVFEPTPMFSNLGYSHQTLISQVNCDARPIYASYDYSGYLPVPVRAGAIYERLAAYSMLGDPTTRFVATDQMNDIQRYLISYYSLFPKELTNVFGGMLANKTDLWGWHMTVDDEGKPKNCVRRNVVGPDAVNPGGGEEVWPFNPEPEYIFPTTRFRFPMLAAYYGLGLFLDSFDHSFVDVTRVYLEGHSTAITPNDDAEVVTFEDPLSGKVYKAVKPAKNGMFHPAAHMMEELLAELGKYTSLQELQDNYNFSEYQFILDKLELLRHMNYIYDYGQAE